MASVGCELCPAPLGLGIVFAAETQGGAHSSLALGWLVDGLWPSIPQNGLHVHGIDRVRHAIFDPTIQASERGETRHLGRGEENAY
jgi:hypothetical protein